MTSGILDLISLRSVYCDTYVCIYPDVEHSIPVLNGQIHQKTYSA